jgi:hypothetical protein
MEMGPIKHSREVPNNDSKRMPMNLTFIPTDYTETPIL